MDVILIFAFVIAVGFLLLMINYFRKQSVDQFMKANQNVPPLFMQKAVDNKLRTLHHALRQNIIEIPDGDPQLLSISKTRLAIGDELAALKESFYKQKISLKVYDHKLNLLLQKMDENVIY